MVSCLQYQLYTRNNNIYKNPSINNHIIKIPVNRLEAISSVIIDSSCVNCSGIIPIVKTMWNNQHLCHRLELLLSEDNSYHGVEP